MFDMLYVGLTLLVFFLFFGVGIIGTVFWLWMLIDCAVKEPSSGNDKLIWILIILLTHLIGALIYFLVRRPKRIRELGE